MSKHPYESLGVAPSASQDEIRNAYRTLAKKYHPDLNPGNRDAEKKFKEIAGAYERIGTAESRAKFDRGEYDEAAGPSPERPRTRAERGPFYHETQREGGRYSQAFGGADEDLFRSFFGDQPGPDALYRLDVDFKDAILGAEREITLPSGKRLRVKIPAGINDGAKLRFPGFGGPGAGKAPAGDAYVELNVKPSALFKRVGDDLEVELPVSFSEAILGVEVKAPTVDGSVLLKIPPGVSSGTRLRVTGKGVPAGGRRGDQFVILKITIPQGVDAELRQAVESWSRRQPHDPRAGMAGGGT